MKNNKDRWLFFQHDSKPKLSSAEMRYNRSLLNKNLKVGIEFEFNLPSQKGSCRGDSNACPCVQMENGEICWQKCLREENCIGKRSPEICINRTEACKKADCVKCERFKTDVDCAGIFCPNFVPVCLCCEEFHVNCETCPDRYDPKRNPDEIRAKIAKEMKPSNSYGTTFDDVGDVKRLHLEMRAPDCLLSPSAIAALACLFHAMMIKAVEISRWGIVEVGDDEWAKQAQKVKDALMNNCPKDFSGDRFSDTSELHKYYDILIDESLDLIRQLKHILIKIGPAYEVLEKIAVKPCSIRLCDGERWENIEKDLAVILDEKGRIEIALEECVDLRYVSECQGVDEWITAVSRILKENVDLEIEDEVNTLKSKITKMVEAKRNDGEIIWSESLGTMIMI